ncbi:hypothetical protein MRX96_005963 [Rhipicephalus microplus]
MREPLCPYPCSKHCSSLHHYYEDCDLTAHIKDLLRPRDALWGGDRAAVLLSRQNRALLTLVITTISAQIPDMTR